jgi:TIR domain-containing protein
MDFRSMALENVKTLLRVFLCHSSTDKPQVRRLYDRLRADGIAPWLDEVDLLPGQDWHIEITRAVKSADVVIVCLSKGAITKEGYVQREIKLALDVAEEKPEATIFIIPLKLEECSIPDRLSRWQWVNWYEEDGYTRLMMSLCKRAEMMSPNLRAQLIHPDTGPAVGVAALVYDNFVRPILTSGEIIYRLQNNVGEGSESARELRGLILLRPENFVQGFAKMRNELEEILTSRFPGEVRQGTPEKIFIRTNEGARTPFFLVRDHLIDIPRTMFSLSRFIKLDLEEGKARRDMEKTMIERFFNSLREMTLEDKKIRAERLHFGSAIEITSIIETGGTRT